MDIVPELTFSLEVNDVQRSFRAVGEGLKNLKVPLRAFGRYLTEKLKKRMENKGDGSWPAYARSTLDRMQHTGITKITKFGKIRAPYLKRLLAYEKRLQGMKKQESVAYKHGSHKRPELSKELQTKLAALEGKIQKLRVKMEKVKTTAFSNRKVRKKSVDKHEMLGKLKYLSANVSSGSLRIGLLKGPTWAWRHNEGDGNLPKRQIVPEALEEEDVDVLIQTLEAHLINLWEHPSQMEAR